MDNLSKKLLLKTLSTQALGVNTKLPPASAKKETGGDTDNKDKVNCYLCIHFKITWEPKFPYSCRAHGFKGPQIPSVVVFNSSGEQCLLFTPKK
jgi:hypothetical protein